MSNGAVVKRLSKASRAKLLTKRGIFAVYKPKGPTSHDIINKLRRETGIKKIGHAGTLDPLASGVLVVGVGREATKKLGSIVKKEKEYLAKIRLGMGSSTDDEEGEKTEFEVVEIPTIAKIKKAVSKFKSEILQIPPIYSALKIKGTPAYKLARKGQTPKLKPRKALIKEIEILKYEWPFLEIRIVTGPGVYIRALARDIGEELKVGGYLAELERTRVGSYSIVKSEALDKTQTWHLTNE